VEFRATKHFKAFIVFWKMKSEKNMFRFWLGLALTFCGFSFSPARGAEVTDWVNPFVGTAKGGNTFPGALVPWGMVSVSPHNAPQAPSGYIYGEPALYGFGHVHLSGTGCPDLGSILLMPTAGDVKTSPEQWKSAYDSETAAPGYYSVHLKTYDIQAEMTATTRVGVSQYFFPARKGDANILLDVSHRLTTDPVTLKSPVFESGVKIVSNKEVEGFSESGDFCSPYAGNRQTVYFVAQFSKPAFRAGTWRDGLVSEKKDQKGKDIGAFFRFSTTGQEPIIVKVGVSYVSVENARLNLQTEVSGWDFQAIRSQALKDWEEVLARIKITGGSDDQLKIFYTALYHALIHPSVFSDVNNQYQGMNHTGVKTADSYTRYHVFSLWDTYRDLHPFLALFYPERDLDMVKSLVEMAKEGGWLPKWELAGNETSVMVGCPAVPVLLDAYRQGVKDFDVASAYDSMVKSLNPKDNKIYGGLKSLLQYGFIPKNDDSGDYLWGSVSTSLEYSYDFWCLAQMAKDLKKPEDYDKYIHLSGVYRNFYDSSTGFLRAKNRDGTWMTPFNPEAGCCDQSWPDNGGPGYVEGTAWQYLFFAPQDMDGLKMLLGGDDAFVKRLQQCFDGGHYDATNEPDIAWPYLFDYVPQEAWRTQKEVRELMGKYYKSTPDGIPGNDDCGVMSVWYLFSALGFYPVCPGSNSYQLGSPLFQEVDVYLDKMIYPSGLLTLKSINNSADNFYVQSLLVDGMEYKKKFFDHDTLVYGKNIVFRMDNEAHP
jgi:predicted alpha-1,2-mannosidase